MDGTAVQGEDYVAFDQMITFVPNQISKEVILAVKHVLILALFSLLNK